MSVAAIRPVLDQYVGYYGTAYRYRSAGSGANTLTWPVPVPVSGRYKVYARWPAAASFASNARFTVTHETGNGTVILDQRRNGGEWHLLGSYVFMLRQGHGVTLDDNADGIASINFLAVLTAPFKSLFGLEIISHDRRGLRHVAVAAHPTANWIGREVSEAFPWDTAPSCLIRDREGAYGELFRRRLGSMYRECLDPHDRLW